jgi:hypothetical protein
MAVRMPPVGQRVIEDNGQMNDKWRDFFRYIESLQPLDEIVNPSFTVTALTPGSTAYSPTTGVSKTFTVLGAFTPVIQAALTYGTGVTAQNLVDDFATIADALTKAATNHTSIQTAVSALNTRVTALENKENEVISDLDSRFP